SPRLTIWLRRPQQELRAPSTPSPEEARSSPSPRWLVWGYQQWRRTSPIRLPSYPVTSRAVGRSAMTSDRSSHRPDPYPCQPRPLAVTPLAGGLCGSVLLVTIPASAFRTAVPYLILLSCLLLALQNQIRDWLRPSGAGQPGSRRRAGPGGGTDPVEAEPVSPA